MHSNFPMPALPADLPWAQGAYLLLDGVSLPDLQHKLYGWTESPEFEPLYLGTEWHELNDLSPCLVSLNGLRDPVMQRFVESAQLEWGYLIFAKASFDELLRHLRWLICVQSAQGEAMLLRLADPAVAHQLLATGSPQLFGPIEQICAADCIESRWWLHSRAGEPQHQTAQTRYVLSDTELAALGEVSFRQVVMRLDSHMREFFPHYQQTLRGRERLAHLRELAERAYRQGMGSEREITLYANVFGFLGEQRLEDHPDIASLLNDKSPQTPAQRIEQAASLAQVRAAQIEGTHA